MHGVHTQHHKVTNHKITLQNRRLFVGQCDILDGKCEGPQIVAMLRLRIMLHNFVATTPTCRHHTSSTVVIVVRLFTTSRWEKTTTWDSRSCFYVVASSTYACRENFALGTSNHMHVALCHLTPHMDVIKDNSY